MPVESKDTTEQAEVMWRHDEEQPAFAPLTSWGVVSVSQGAEHAGATDEAIQACQSLHCVALTRQNSVVVGLVYGDGTLLPIGGGFHAILAQAAFADQMSPERFCGSSLSGNPRITISARQRERGNRLS